jgi:hypothetical protein
MAGRKPIGDQPLTKTERQRRWRQGKKIFKEECEKYSVAAGADLMIDQKMLAAFRSIAAEIPETDVHDLVFIAMREFLKSDQEHRQHAERQGIDDIDKHLFMLSAAQAAVFLRIKRNHS